VTLTVTSSDGKLTATQCNYRHVDPDGTEETCHHAASCKICGQCSRIDGNGHEHGHCPGHMGLSEHIPGIPGEADAKTKAEIESSRERAHQRRHGPRHARREARK
jgi:hypothetical protein